MSLDVIVVVGILFLAVSYGALGLYSAMQLSDREAAQLLKPRVERVVSDAFRAAVSAKIDPEGGWLEAGDSRRGRWGELDVHVTVFELSAYDETTMLVRLADAPGLQEFDVSLTPVRDGAPKREGSDAANLQSHLANLAPSSRAALAEPGAFRGLDARDMALPTLRFAFAELSADAVALVDRTLAAVLALDAEVGATRSAATQIPVLDAHETLGLSGERGSVSPEGAPVAIPSRMNLPPRGEGE